ncbi:hypothetical protein ACE02Y_10170 [Shewanella xiamenensis]|uniref:Uncharacterized protein n=2 Tax=Shewanella xiamenensis TaxID=332186 RepID=A0A073KPW0_9GAMM|nr:MULTISPECIES: hypothetical protein [Shewanella]KEK28570.1 hypothetical protein SXM_1746 [Shewanella xiamenensis]KPN77329.1 hypothetical protein AEA42_08875 [Shewanella sp. Sh95]MBW0281165.1 hypothetical protein [Shewanella xiamenensis]MBW0297694.1 hypothetical protein [Shewanella xiamenensis]MCH7423430.1 hypothetical protein [Shewanella sp. MM_2022_3]
MSKPNTKTAMQQLIAQIQQTIPLNLDEAQMCQGECLGCSKKMLEMLDAEISYWQYSDAVPSLKDLKNLENIGRRTYKILKRNQLVS